MSDEYRSHSACTFTASGLTPAASIAAANSSIEFQCTATAFFFLGDSDFDDFLVRADAVKDRLIPNFPFVPGAYSTKKIEKARVSKSPLRTDDNELLAFLNTVGIKLQKVDLTKLKRVKTFEFSRRVRGVQEQIREQAAEYRNGSISLEEYNHEVKKLQDKYTKIRNRYIKALNIPARNQEAVPLSEALPTIGEAIKEQTQQIFGKN